MADYLVVGGSRGLGQQVAGHLRKCGHTVHTMQRTPSEEEMDTATWHRVDFTDPATAVNAVREVLELPSFERFQGVFFAPCLHTVQPVELISQYDLQAAYMVNVAGPVMLLTYLWTYDLVDKDSRAVFMLDERPLDETHLPYVLTKAGLKPAVEAWGRAYGFPVPVLFTHKPEKVGEEELGVMEHVLSAHYHPPGGMI